MADTPLVSILVPTRDRRTFVPQLLRYIARQTWPADRLELIVVDDGRDGVRDLFDAFDHVPVTYEHTGSRIPLGLKRNRLVELSKGEILVHMDDDDYYPPKRIERAVTALEDPAIAVVGTSKLAFWDSGTGAIHQFPAIGPKHAHAGTMAFRRTYWEQHRFAPDAHSEERQFLRCFVAPLAQLPGNPWEHVLCISHGGNALPKNTQLPRLPLTLEEVVTDPEDRAFYANLDEEDW